MEFLYKKQSKFKIVRNVAGILIVAVVAITTLVTGEQAPAAGPQIVKVQNDSLHTVAAASAKSVISNEYIAAATSAQAAPAPAQAKTAPAAEANSQPEEQNQTAQATEDANTVFTEGAIQSITFKKDMSVREALRFLQQRFHKNIVPSVKVDGAIPITALYDVTFEEALNAILGNNFKWEKDNNFIRIYAADEYKKMKEDEGRMQHKVFTLYYVTSAEVEKLVKPILSDKGKVQSSSAAADKISNVSGSMGSGSGGSSSGGSTSMEAGGGGDKMALHDSIVVYDYPENIAKAQDIVAKLDARPKQVLVEATILSADLTEGMELGVDLNFLNGVTLTGDLAQLETVSGTPIENSTRFPDEALGSGLKVGITGGSMTALIRALETVTDTTILANPKILAVNKQEGAVQIGTTLGYRDSTTVSSSGVATQGEVKFLPTGTVLVFRPYIGDDGYIRMDIFPKDSTAKLNSDKVPDEVTTQLKTNVLVKDGETIVIGGLFRDDVITTRTQVPILGDLPFVGVLFRGTNDTSRRQEVIILLTPHIIDNAAQTDAQARVEDIERKRFGAIRGLQWLQRSRLADDWYAAAVESYSKGEKEAALDKLKWVLELRPTYQEAMKLQEKIVAELGSDGISVMRRIMMERIGSEKNTWVRY
jgi:type IV pilus assembly protein PilQ